MASNHPFGNDPEKIERYRAFWNRDSVDRPLVGFSFVGWYPLLHSHYSRLPNPSAAREPRTSRRLATDPWHVIRQSGQCAPYYETVAVI